jgi:hypothetical protein
MPADTYAWLSTYSNVQTDPGAPVPLSLLGKYTGESSAHSYDERYGYLTVG